MKMEVTLTDQQKKALDSAIKILENATPHTADELRRAFEYKLFDLKRPTKEEQQCIDFASMH